MILNTENKYICKDKEKLKEIMKREGFIFKDSTLQRDEYFIDLNSKMLSKEACIRLRCTNNKEIVLSFDGTIENISSLDIKDMQKIHSDISQYENIISFLADLGYYKYVSLNILKETYVKKDKEYYYNIRIDTVENVGEFIDYSIYTESNDTEKANSIFDKFEKTLEEALSEQVKNKYRDYSAKYIYNTLYKGDNLKKILVEMDKILCDLDSNNIENTIKNKYTILNLELIEKIEQMGIEVSVVYSSADEELVENIKTYLNKVGYAPNFMNITQIKEIAVRETLIIEKQKKIEFSEVALCIINNKKDRE